MVAVWIILGFLAGFVANNVIGLFLLKRMTKCQSTKDALTYVSNAYKVKATKNETNRPVSAVINYDDYSETLELK